MHVTNVSYKNNIKDVWDIFRRRYYIDVQFSLYYTGAHEATSNV